MNEQEERLRLQVDPQPTDEELAAIAAAVTTLTLRKVDDKTPRETGGGRERWTRAGRRELLRSFVRGRE